jgi:hypothetical protein
VAKKCGVPETLLNALNVFIKQSKTDDNYELRQLASDLAECKQRASIDSIRLTPSDCDGSVSLIVCELSVCVAFLGYVQVCRRPCCGAQCMKTPL